MHVVEMLDWNIVVNIAEALALGISILGVTGLGWYIAGKVIDKLIHKD